MRKFSHISYSPTLENLKKVKTEMENNHSELSTISNSRKKKKKKKKNKKKKKKNAVKTIIITTIIIL